MKAIAGVALTLAAVALGVAVLDTASDNDPEEVTLALTDKEESHHYTDVPPRSELAHPEYKLDFSAGDSFTFTSDIRGDRKGKLSGSCVFTPGLRASCRGTYVLDDGTVEVAASPDFEAESFEMAVIGGTGAYSGATGSATYPEGEGEKISYDLHLFVP